MAYADIEALRKRYGDRLAFEWFMRAEDKRYWSMAKRLIQEEKEKVMATLKRSGITITILLFIFYLIIALHNRLLLARN